MMLGRQHYSKKACFKNSLKRGFSQFHDPESNNTGWQLLLCIWAFSLGEIRPFA